jgi:hypothetical protein
VYVRLFLPKRAHLLLEVGEIEPEADGIVDSIAQGAVAGMVDHFSRRRV